MDQKTATATARKAGDVYKPVIKYPQVGIAGPRTEVVEQSSELRGITKKDGRRIGVQGQGVTYGTRAEAIEAAQREIEARREAAILRRDQFEKGTRVYEYTDKQVALWGG